MTASRTTSAQATESRSRVAQSTAPPSGAEVEARALASPLSEVRPAPSRPPMTVPAVPTVDELESVLSSKVSMPNSDPTTEGPKYSPFRLLAVTLTGKGTPLMVIGLIVAGGGGIWLIVVA